MVITGAKSSERFGTDHGSDLRDLGQPGQLKHRDWDSPENRHESSRTARKSKMYVLGQPVKLNPHNWDSPENYMLVSGASAYQPERTTS